MSKFFFRNDYSYGAHPKVLEAVCAVNLEGPLGREPSRYSIISRYACLVSETFG